MNTLAEMNEKMKEEFLLLAREEKTVSKVFPERFMRLMEQNIGAVSTLCCYGKDEEGLERRNPLIVVLGDSVTAGRFENSMRGLEMESSKSQDPKDMIYPSVIADVLESYPDRFRRKLVELYEDTSVNVVNAGIGGDTMIGMRERLQRDVISLQPDLVIINGTLNWNQQLGSVNDFYNALKDVVQRVKSETQADIILLTPNMNAKERMEMVMGEKDTLDERVEMVRRVADEEKTALADVYRIWKKFVSSGADVVQMLSNGYNHPTMAGHEVFALELMKLFPQNVHNEAWKQAAVSSLQKD